MRPALAVLLAFVLAGFVAAQPAEQSFGGRPLSAWIRDLNDRNVLVREEALEALAQLGPSAAGAADVIRPLLRDPLTTTRLRAALALGRIEKKTDAVHPVLLEAAKDPARSIRLLVLDSLQEIGAEAKEVAPILVECLSDTDPGLRERARAWLERLGTAALPALVKALGHAHVEIVQQSLRLIGTLGAGAAGSTDAVRERLKDKSHQIRIAAAHTFWLVTKDTEVPAGVLAELMRDPGAGLRGQAFSVLVQLRPIPRAAVPAFEATLDDTDLLTRIRAAEALWEFDGRTKTTLPVLIDGLKQTNFSLHNQARGVLGRMQAHAKEIVPAVIAIARAARPGGANLASLGYVLGRMGDEAVEPLEALLREKDAGLRSMAFGALIESGDRGALVVTKLLPKAERGEQVSICRQFVRYRGKSEDVAKALAEVIRGGDVNLADSALTALGQFGPRAAPAAAAIAELLKDPKFNQVIRHRVAMLFGNIGPAGKAAVPALLEVANDDKADEYLRQQAISSLGAIGPGASGAVAGLAKMVKGSRPQFRYAILSAISQIDPLHEALVPALVELVKDAEARRTGVRSSAMTLLGGLGADAKAAVPGLVAMLRENLPAFEKRDVIVALGRIGPSAGEAVAAIKEQLADKNAFIPPEAACTLVLLGVRDRELVPHLVRGVQTRQLWSRPTALDALAEMGAEASSHAGELLAVWRTENNATEKLRLAEIVCAIDPKAAKEMEIWLRTQQANAYTGARAAAVLWRLDPRSPDGLPYLVKLLREPYHYNRAQAMQGLAQIGPPAREALPEVESALEAKPDPKLPPETRAAQEAEYLNLRIWAARALWRIEPKKTDRAAAVLVEALRHEGPALAYYRGQAAEALGLLGPAAKSALPALIEIYPTQPVALRRSILDAVRKIDPKSVTKLFR